MEPKVSMSTDTLQGTGEDRAHCLRQIAALEDWNRTARALLAATETVLAVERAKLAALEALS